MVAVCVIFVAYTGLCCLFSGYLLRFCVLVFNFISSVENLLFAKGVFIG
jgi:hypothetical protein